MTLWHEDSLMVNGASFHYLRSGGAHPTLLMLHGFTDSARNCEALARELIADYDVILVDERGHGLSSAAPSDYSLADQAHDIAAFIQGMGLSKPIIFGHSIGAATAVQTAALYPDLLSLVILEDPPFRSESPILDHTEWHDNLAAFKQRPYEAQLAEALREHGHWGEDENKIWVGSKKQFDLAMFQTPLITRLLDWQQAAPLITIPGLLITGDPEHGAIVTPEIAQEIQALWANLSVAHIENAGHSIRRDQPALFTQIIKDYLRRSAV